MNPDWGNDQKVKLEKRHATDCSRIKLWQWQWAKNESRGYGMWFYYSLFTRKPSIHDVWRHQKFFSQHVFLYT